MAACFITPRDPPSSLGLELPLPRRSAWPALEGRGPTCPSGPLTQAAQEEWWRGGPRGAETGRLGLGAAQVSCALTLRAVQNLLWLFPV